MEGYSQSEAPPNADCIEDANIDLDQESPFEPIAIVGFSLKFPQDAVSEESFWDLLQQRRSTMTEVPQDRWNGDAFFKPEGNKAGTMKVKRGHFLKEDLAGFDAPFFSISPQEAECMDPQQRLLLETSYHALENAGIPLERATGSNTSVHVGCFMLDYGLLLGRDAELSAKYKVTGASALTILANRLSWFYDFQGPSMAIDTACSSSLVSLHLACQELQSRSVDMGLVAGCNTFLNPDSSAQLSDLNFLSPDGVCHSFDEKANGYSRGEGFGVLVLKRLSQAIEDGDTVRGIIRSTGCNQDGRTPGITQPSSQSQERLIRETYRRAGLDMSQTRLFEAHGTGTPVGDPLEASAISRAFSEHRTKADPIYIGAVKSNIGHLEGGAGMAGVIKTLLSLEHGIIAPNVYPETVNTKISAECENVAFPIAPMMWPKRGLRRASVNSFGFGGTNAHIVLDDAYHYCSARSLQVRHRTRVSQPRPKAWPVDIPTRQSGAASDISSYDDAAISNSLDSPPSLLDVALHGGSTTDEGYSSYGGSTTDEDVRLDFDQTEFPRSRLLTLSTFDESGIQRTLSAHNEWLLDSIGRKDTAPDLDELAYTLCERRSMLPWRSVAVASEDNLGRLDWSAPVRTLTNLKVCFLFTGQGAQWHQMGRELLQYPIFGESMEKADRYFRSLGSKWSMVEELYTKSKDASRVNAPECSQPICTAIQVATVDLLKSWNVSPTVTIGHSSGEIAAAYASGAISRSSAWMIAYYRGLAVAAVRDLNPAPGAMVSVQASPDKAQTFLDQHNTVYASDKLVIACYNSPSNVTVSGSWEAVDRVAAILTDAGVIFRLLNVDVAYHSHHMKTVGMIYERLLRKISQGKESADSPQFVSSVTGALLESKNRLRTAEYWITNLVESVRFSDAMSQICEGRKMSEKKTISFAADFIVEIGPHSALRSPVKDIFRSLGRTLTTEYASILSRNLPANATAIECVGKLHCIGWPVDLSAVNQTRSTQAKSLTSLPYYPFNHNNKYWQEGRLSKGFRFRKHPHHELLGTRVSDWNELEARWNNRIVLSEKPFLKDHRVNGLVLYPAAGMLVMAIEAMREMSCDESGKIRGFRIRDVAFSKAIVLSEGAQGTETQLTLRPSNDKTTKSCGAWSEFTLFVYEGDAWSECCRGAISVDIEQSSHPFAVDEHQAFLESKMEVLQQGMTDCANTIDIDKAYSVFAQSGIEYGPTFQGMQQLKWDNSNQATATVDLHHWRSYTEYKYCEKHLIHPSTLDALFQLMLPSLSNGGNDPFPTGVPTRIFNAWISADLLIAPPDAKFIAHSNMKKESFRTFHASVIASLSESDEPCLTGEIEMSTVADAAPAPGSKEELSKRLFNMTWKPDFDLLQEPLPTGKLAANREPHINEKEALCLAGITNALANFKSDAEMLPLQLQRFVQWAKWQASQHPNIEVPPVEELIAKLEDHDIEGAVLSRVARNLDAILAGDVDTLNLLFSDDIMTKYYLDFSTTPILLSQTAQHIDVLAHKYPEMRVLEIGAGTGCATGHIVDILGNRMKEYVFTDISPSFFGKAKERFHGKKMSFKTLDISKDVEAQGFEPDSYDLVIAANVLHATDSIPQSLINVRKLLKTGGRMILLENVNRRMMRGGFIFGLLPGWWCSPESAKNLSPLLTDSEWNTTFQQSGFSGTDIRISDAGYESEVTVLQIMMTTATSTDRKDSLFAESRKVSLILDERSPIQLEMEEALSWQLATKEDYEVSVVSWQDIEASTSQLENSVCIFLPGIDSTLLGRLDQGGLDRLKIVIASVDSLLWVSQEDRTAIHNPKEGMVRGLARTIQSEQDYRFITLMLEKSDNHSRAVQHILAIADRELCNESAETEYTERDGLLCINRVIENEALIQQVFPDTRALSTVSVPWKHAGNVHLSIANVGLLDKLYYVEMPIEAAFLGPEEIEIDVKAAGLNFRDVLTALGQVNGTYFGNECAGVVTRVGPSTSHAIKVGDRVVGVTEKAMSKTCRCYGYQVQKMPDTMGFNEAASYAVAYCTAYYSLTHWARIQKGESVLIHSGAGGFGQAAIQLAQHFGCEIYVTVGAAEKAEMLSKTYGIPLNHIFSSRNLDFAKGIKRMTNGRGVDVVLNSLAGEALRQSWHCIAPFGRFIEVGKKDIYGPPVTTMGGLPMFPFSRNCMFASVDLPQVAARPDFAEILAEVMNLAERKIITPPQPLRVFKQSEAENAFRFMQTGKHTGKIVLEFAEDEVVQVKPAAREGSLFDANATYLIAGAFGGIGKSVAKWMVTKGARNLVLPSRSQVQGADNDRAALVKELREEGARVEAPLCDIAIRAQLKQTLEALEDMPPIKGCIQSAMVLKDASFQNMTESQWQTALAPKLAGSWNLHELLPKEMSFFVMLASQAGIAGPFGQSNYAAGNAYQDALSTHRVRHGLPSVSIDLGTVASVGYVAENAHVKAMMRTRGALEDLSEEDVLSLLEHYCSPDGVVKDESKAQVITSLPLPAELRAQGVVEPIHLTRPLFHHLRTIVPSQSASSESTTAAVKPASVLLKDAKTLDEASDIISEAVRTQLSNLLVVDRENIDAAKPIYVFGVDSLVAVEMRNWFAKGVGADVSVMEILGGEAIRDLAVGVARKSRFVNAEVKG
ncbi:polyketide synthase-like protein [Lophiotrema nucula]|uniref:Polyketide synthase-like protein n=1 Tax=Lophiotrema nucula TaxID=690887 RepID=A0A6A5YIB5_9PLEO|nr:polyketide synthase-like protein [Lophiotrema nucula]